MPEILTKRLCLSPLSVAIPELITVHLGWLQDPEVVKYSEQRHRTHTKTTCKQYIRSFDQQKDHLWAILDKKVSVTDHWVDYYIGNISAHVDKNNSVAEVGIMIGEKQVWGKGYGTEAWQGVCDWLLTNNVRKIEAGCRADNFAMKSVMGKTRMAVEGARNGHFVNEYKDSPFANDTEVDMLLYARFK